MKLNPVFKNEIKLSSRTMKSSWMVFGYNAVLIVASMMVLYSMMDTVHYGYSMDYSEMVGLYVVMAYMEFGMILLIIPAITAGSIAGERERQTLDMLLATKMKPWSIVLGKLESSLSSVLMLAVSSLPVLSIVFIFGGVGILELVGFVVILGVSAIFVGSVGIFFSAYTRRVTTATVLTYLAVLFLLGGTLVIESGVYSLVQMQMSAVGQTEGITVGNVIGLLLVNPAVTFYGMVSSQVGAPGAIVALWTRFGLNGAEGILTHWIAVSEVVQLLLSGVLLYLAGRKINPLK